MISFLKKISPKSLFVRSLIILITPLVFVQIVLSYIFFDRHTETILRMLSKNIAGEIALVVEWIENEKNVFKIQKLAKQNLEISISLKSEKALKRKGLHKQQWLYHHLGNALNESLEKPYFISMTDDKIIIQTESKRGVLECEMSRKRLFSRTTPLVLIWTTVSGGLLLIIAALFMRNQIRPIKRLADAAERFGKGEDTVEFKPEGASEVRQAGLAFLEMRERLTRLIADRMQMLAGVSHDIRTPLTRMKLQVSLMSNGSEEKEGLTQDIGEMQEMLEVYLNYARGSTDEPKTLCDLGEILSEIANKHRNENFKIDLILPKETKLFLKPHTVKRLLTNIIVNSTVYGTCLRITVEKRVRDLEIIFDDNGPGIPEEERENVFKPFYRLDKSRSSSGNVGLGLSIVRDGIRHHGGQISLKNSPLGGLRIVVLFPL